MKSPFLDFIDAQSRQLERGSSPPLGDWRRIERVLLEYLQSRRIHITDVCGEPRLEVVRCREGDEAITGIISIEDLAQHLATDLRH